MKQWLKVTMWILAPIAGIGIIGFLAIWFLWHATFNSNSCERFNIDNIETRIRVDIPSIMREQSECFLNKVENTKTNYFRIRTDVEDMDRYVIRNSFIPVIDTDLLDLSVFEKLAKIPEITPDNIQNFYYNSGIGNYSDWLALVDKNSGDLWVYMKYKKNKKLSFRP